MAQFKGTAAGGDGGGPSDEMIAKVGTAVGRIAAIQQSYGPRVAAAENEDEKQGLQKQATIDAVKAISDQGLTVEQYNEVVVAAQDDTELEERLIEAANGE
jgi:hypothetical protein